MKHVFKSRIVHDGQEFKPGVVCPAVLVEPMQALGVLEAVKEFSNAEAPEVKPSKRPEPRQPAQKR